MKSLLNSSLVAAVMALLLTLAVGGFLELPFGHAPEAWMSDKMLNWRYDLLKHTDPGRQPDPRLVLVAIDQPSVSELGRLPFPRVIHGQLLQGLAPEDPRVVAFDLLFTEKTARGRTSTTQPVSATVAPSAAPVDPASQLQPDDQALVDAAKLFPRLVTTAVGDNENGSTLRDGDFLPTRPLRNIVGNMDGLLSFPFAQVPFPELRKVSTFGFVETNARDRLRTLPLVVKINAQVFPSFDLQILMQYWGVDPDHIVVDLGREITLTGSDGNSRRIPIDEAGEFVINYRARVGDFPTMSYSAMSRGLADQLNHRASAARDSLLPLKDKIVVVGVTAAGADTGPSPVKSYSSEVIAQLNALNNVLQRDYLDEVSPGIWMPLYALFLFAVAHAMLRMGLLPMIPMALTAMVLWADAAFATLWFGNDLMPLLLPEVGVLVLAAAIPAGRYWEAERERTRIKNVLQANLSDKVMNKMLEHPDHVQLGGAKQEITVMFCDIRNFTQYCEDHEPQGLMDALNDYMQEVTDVIFRHDGTVDKYIGDGITAFWNAPQAQPDHAQLAVSCALEMREVLAHFEARWEGADRHYFQCGIGIHTGEALVGNMGSNHKRTYTAMGSTVNMASRLEALTKQLDERILISSGVVKHLDEDTPLLDRGWIRVAGLPRPVHVYAVVTKDNMPSERENGRAPAVMHNSVVRETRKPMWRMAPEDGNGNQA